ncbi:MAG: 4Fe-4S dicluster domain-containing protein [Asgard group archaeon]|nr:4Fe-4S dicluster domain-containing protein [Asgard group archaeon]
MAEDVYRQLQLHFDEFYLGFPKTESGIEIRLLKRLFTPEEAAIALYIKCGHLGSLKNFDTLEAIFERVKHLGFSLSEVGKMLDNMTKKGAIIGTKRNGSKIYANAVLIVGIYEFQVNKLTKGFLDDMYQYIREAWYAANKFETTQLRTIPVGVTIKHESPIARYDNIKSHFEESNGPFAIVNCICRQSNDLLKSPCQMTDRREVCMSVGDSAYMYIENGWGKEITKEEALNYLKQNEKEGLIFQIGNTQEFDFVCSCCHCCCGDIGHLRKMPNPAELTSSNYLAEINEELCTGCGNCIDRCQMDAITMDNDLSVINQKRCIGCGNCILDCPADAIALVMKEGRKIPPANAEELYDNILNERKKGN